MRTLLVKGLQELDIAASEEQISLLLTYAHEIEKGNRQVNLVRAEGKELVINHLLDSLAGLKIVAKLWSDYQQAQPISPNTSPIADIGSGAGLPAIPLALFMPHARFTLIENSPRKAIFLRNTAELLKLPQVLVINQDIEAVTDLFPLIIFRAFTPLSKEIFRSVFDRLAPRGTLVAYKGRQETIQAELESVSPFISSRVSTELIPIHVPFLDKERHLLVLHKVD